MEFAYIKLTGIRHVFECNNTRLRGKENISKGRKKGKNLKTYFFRVNDKLKIRKVNETPGPCPESFSIL